MMNARLSLSLAAVFTVGLLARSTPAQPATMPTNLPSAAGLRDSDSRPTDQLQTAAFTAFDAGDYASALPMLKNLSIRLRDKPDEVGPILEKVRVCETQIAQQQGAPQVEGINAPRTPHQKPTDGTPYELTLQKLGNFNYDAEHGGNIPGDVTALTGATLKVSGYMIPIDEADKITKFVLVPDLFGCCFGQPPQVQHTAIIVCPPGKAVTYFPDQITVVGTLNVNEKKDDGFVTSIFQITAQSIRPAGH